MYVADYSDHNVTVISGLATNGSIQVGTDPTSFAYDPLNDTIFVANYGTANISVVDASSNQLAGSFSAYFPQYLAYDAQSNSLYMVTSENGEVAAYNATSYASLGTPLVIQSSVRAGGIAYSSASGDIYVSNEYDSSISILSSVAVTFYSVWFNETGLPALQNWAVNLQGTPGSSSTSSILFSEQNGSYSFTVGAVTGYTPNTTSRNGLRARRTGDRVDPFPGGAWTDRLPHYLQRDRPPGGDHVVGLTNSHRERQLARHRSHVDRLQRTERDLYIHRRDRDRLLGFAELQFRGRGGPSGLSADHVLRRGEPPERVPHRGPRQPDVGREHRLDNVHDRGDGPVFLRLHRPARGLRYVQCHRLRVVLRPSPEPSRSP